MEKVTLLPENTEFVGPEEEQEYLLQSVCFIRAAFHASSLMVLALLFLPAYSE